MTEHLQPGGLAHASNLDAIIIGTGFAGLGMAIALKQQGIENFVILEKTQDVGGVWRDNSYPGAACDVPSHLYSFSFEPNPDWSRVFATQGEIHSYLQHCARKYGLLPHVRFGVEMRQAEFDERHSRWTVTTADGQQFTAKLLITATGQLSRPVLPQLPGLETFKGHTFHSAQWDHQYALDGKRVAAVGTGASAIQFVPAIADRVAQLSVFQRSPAYILPRPDRPYTGLEKKLFALPWLSKLHRAGIYLKYESRALAFTRFQWLMKPAGLMPFHRLLKRQVQDPTLRAKMTPDYQIGCKRILLSSEYLATFAKPQVALCTEGIRRVTPEGIETQDGKLHPADAIVFGTGFAATEFLAPMRITGRQGLDLQTAWKGGAKAYLGLTVPGFPNFFMLYGPNTNLGHNSIVYMLESQIAHVVRCLQQMRSTGTSTIEVREAPFLRFNAHIQQRLKNSVWSVCTSWYVDAQGHNSTNWPDFTLSYRWLLKRGSLDAYRFSEPRTEAVAPTAEIAAPTDIVEQAQSAFLRGFLRVAFRTFIGPPYGAVAQRRWVNVLSILMPARSGVQRQTTVIGNIPVTITHPKATTADGVVLYLHGGAFCVASPHTHRSITSHLAHASGMPVWAPDYRLAPEHPYPAALEDATSVYEFLLQQGYAPARIVLAGDSAGGALALALAIQLRDQDAPQPAGLALISPVTDPTLGGASVQEQAGTDPMIRKGWVEQGVAWYGCPPGTPSHTPLATSLQELPPMHIQVGDREILLSDSVRLAEHAAACGVDCQLDIHRGRWHVFHLQALFLRSSVQALETLAQFARARVHAALSTPPAKELP